MRSSVLLEKHTTKQAYLINNKNIYHYKSIININYGII